ncbi:MAG: ABC transporter substrate-binding protein, partial [Dehalococcoidales bacterium]|nr:ABC transporter substrate-binding protein [Dehalococcoidales bacterium]
IIPDASSRLAALRTAEIDHLRQVGDEDAELLRTQVPALKEARFPLEPYGLNLRVDKPELPWYDKKVRQALMMALDRDTIVRDYYRGRAEKYNYPVAAFPVWKGIGAYVPFEQLPANVRELFEYNPDKARQMLADAGYPNGFNMELVIESIPERIDEATIVRQQFAKVGVELELQPKESGTFNSISVGMGHQHAIWNTVEGSFIADWEYVRPGAPDNRAGVNDPYATAQSDEFSKYYIVDDDKAYPIIANFVPYALDQAWYIQFPTPYTYTMWWPWVQNYGGEWCIGVAAVWGFAKYVWIDGGLKQSMGY